MARCESPCSTAGIAVGECPLKSARKRRRISEKENLEDFTSNFTSNEESNKNNAKLPNEQCSVCLCADLTHIFVPCGHYCVCFECGSKCKKCPICRAKKKSVIRVHKV